MNNNGTRVKIFYVKNRSTSKNNRPISQDSSNRNRSLYLDLSTFKNQYLSKNRSRKKDLTHLSTLLQRDKVDNFQEQDKINQQNKFRTSKSLGIQPIYTHQDQFQTKFSTQKLNRNLITQLSQSHNELKKIKDEVKLFPFPQASHVNFNQSQQKFFTLTLQQKFIKPNNLSSIFKQKWCEQKLRKGQQKISNVLKTTLNFNSHVFQERQKARIKQKQLNKISKNYSQLQEKQTKIKIKQNFLNFIEEKKSSFSQPKVKDIKSQKLISEGKIIYEPSQRDLQKSQDRIKSNSQIKNPKKSNMFPSRIKKLFYQQPPKKLSKKEQIFNHRIFQNKNFSNKMIDKKRKSIFLSKEDQQQLWWTRQQIAQKSGFNFDLKKATTFI